jgi:hypothetical protein
MNISFGILDSNTVEVSAPDMVVGGFYRVNRAINPEYVGCVACRTDIDEICFWLYSEDGSRFANVGLSYCMEMSFVRTKNFILMDNTSEK